MDEVYTKTLTVKLTADEIKAYGEELASLCDKIAEEEEDKRLANKNASDRIRGLQQKVTAITPRIQDGEEIRAVECDVDMDYDSYTVTISRQDTGEVVEVRPMTEEEKQPELEM